MASSIASSSANEVSIRQARSGSLARQFAADGDAASVRQPDVQHRDLGPQCRHSRERLGGVGCFADDDDVPVGLDHLFHAAAYDLMVVAEKHADPVIHGNPACVEKASG